MTSDVQKVDKVEWNCPKWGFPIKIDRGPEGMVRIIIDGRECLVTQEAWEQIKTFVNQDFDMMRFHHVKIS